MTHVPYLLAGWGISLGTFGLYGWSVVRRGRRLSAQVPVERRRWMQANDNQANDNQANDNHANDNHANDNHANPNEVS